MSESQLSNCNGSASCGNASSVKVNPLDPIPAQLRKVDGIDKLRRLIAKELNSENSDDKCSNLPHLLSIVKCILNFTNTNTGSSSAGSHQNGPSPRLPSAVLKPFSYSHGKAKRFIVDIVSFDGTEWCKVSARNPKSLTLLAGGGGGFGQRSILDHAVDYIECAKQNPCFFRPPSIKFIFTSGISASLAEQLISYGLTVEGEVIQDSELRVHPRIKSYQDCATHQSLNVDEETKSNPDHEDEYAVSALMLRNPSLENVTRLNLDITALLAYVSVALYFMVFCQMGQDHIFHGRELWCCQTAMREFQSILTTVGGQAEQYRAAEFMKRINVVPDHMSERSMSLDIIGNVKLRSLTIFGTGDFYEAVTVTANEGFVRSARTQGVDFAVFLHESRALTEGKEKDIILDLGFSLNNLNMNTSM